jgi:hypothetical protein
MERSVQADRGPHEQKVLNSRGMIKNVGVENVSMQMIVPTCVVKY